MGWRKRIPRHLARVLALSVEERRLLLEAWLRLLAVKVELRTPLRRRLLAAGTAGGGDRPRRGPGSGADAEVVRQIEALVASASAHHVRHVTCLERSLALQWMLACRGVHVRLRLGVRREGRGLDAHAWLEGAGLGPDRAREAYALLEGMGRSAR